MSYSERDHYLAGLMQHPGGNGQLPKAVRIESTSDRVEYFDRTGRLIDIKYKRTRPETRAQYEYARDGAERSSERPIVRFVTVSEYAAQRPRQNPLVDGWLDRGALVGLVGPPKLAKSFWALRVGLHVQTGLPCDGRTVQQGQVFYCLNEVDRYFPVRDRAWRACNGVSDDTGLLVSKSPIALMNPAEVRRLITEDLTPCEAVLVVVDTLGKTLALSNGEENSAKDLGALIANCDRIRDATGATVLLLHHVGKDGKGPRGSSALEAAVDSLLTMKSTGKRPNGTKGVKLESTYQRNAPDFPPLHYELRTIELEPNLTSCVLVPVDAAPADTSAAPLTPSAEKILDVLRQRAGGLRWGQWQDASALPDSTFKSAYCQLKEQGLVDKANGRWIAVE